MSSRGELGSGLGPIGDFQSLGVSDARGFSIGQVLAQDGAHLATIAKEILIRERTR